MDSIEKHSLDSCPTCRKRIKVVPHFPFLAAFVTCIGLQVTRHQNMMRPAADEYRLRALQDQHSDLVRLSSERAAGSGVGALRAEYLDQLNKDLEERKKLSLEMQPEDERIARQLQAAEDAAAAAERIDLAVPPLPSDNDDRSLEEAERLAQQLAAEEAAVIEADAKYAKQLQEEEDAALEKDRTERMEREREDQALAMRLEEKSSRQKRGSPSAAASSEEKPSRRKRKASDATGEQATKSPKR